MLNVHIMIFIFRSQSKSKELDQGVLGLDLLESREFEYFKCCEFEYGRSFCIAGGPVTNRIHPWSCNSGEQKSVYASHTISRWWFKSWLLFSKCGVWRYFDTKEIGRMQNLPGWGCRFKYGDSMFLLWQLEG